MATESMEAPSSKGYWGTVLTRPVLSWSLYDLANTVFSMSIVSLILPPWVLDNGGTVETWGYANSLTMVLVLICAPILGALSDQAGRRLPFLMVCTVACVAFTAALGLGGLWGTLAVFVVANYFFQASLIFYDATLPVVSTKRTRGVVGGFGIGLGYLGSFIAVLIAFLWVVSLSGAVAVPVLGIPTIWFWPVACLVGIALGGTWAADRPYMLILAPPRRLGEFYGLYSMVGRFSGAIGPAMFALVSVRLGLGLPAAMGSLLLWIVIAWWILRGVSDEEREWGPEDRVALEAAG